MNSSISIMNLYIKLRKIGIIILPMPIKSILGVLSAMCLFFLSLGITLFSSEFVLAGGEIKEELIEAESRPDAIQKFLLLTPEKPKASLILIGGGSGKYSMSSFFGKVKIRNSDNFLVRTRNDFAKEGFIVAAIDVVSDKSGDDDGLDVVWRVSPHHGEDIRSVVKFLKNRAEIPIWVIGTSRGTFSAVNACIYISEMVDGLVLTSPVTQSNNAAVFKKGILDMHLEKIMIPTLIVSHIDDGCVFSPPSDADKIKLKLTNSPLVEVVKIKGGFAPKSEPCKPLSQHGYYGVEKDAVLGITSFIKANTK